VVPSIRFVSYSGGVGSDRARVVRPVTHDDVGAGDRVAAFNHGPTRRDEVVTKETYDWDTSTLPEGRYRVRVTASDELSNPPDRVTRDDAESGIVLVDNTPPRLENLRATGRRVQGAALDGVGPIQRIDVALAGRDEWVPFYPKDGIFDEAREEFDFDATVLSPQGPAILAVRVYDDANNFVIQNVQLK
jgi:hypothetical protein